MTARRAAPIWIDHVRLAVEDPDRYVADLLEAHGLTSYAQGDRRVVPCGWAHLEVVPAAAADASHGSSDVGGAGARSWPVLRSWAVATNDLRGFGATSVATASSGVLDPPPGASPALPAVLERARPDVAPASPHAAGTAAIAITCVELAVAPGVLEAWLGRAVHDLPLRTRPGADGLHAVTVATIDGDVVITGGNADVRGSLAPEGVPR